MGPKKKGGKANKLARMTDEQRERYLQHRAAIEEETRRRKEQLIATFMRVRPPNLIAIIKNLMNFFFQIQIKNLLYTASFTECP
jgi:hypothetical protein